MRSMLAPSSSSTQIAPSGACAMPSGALPDGQRMFRDRGLRGGGEEERGGGREHGGETTHRVSMGQMSGSRSHFVR